MEPFEYARPTSIPSAVRLLNSNWGETAILAGGTDLISAMKDGIMTPRRVVSLSRIKGLTQIEYSPHTGLRTGTLTTIRQLLDSADLKQHYPALVEAADGIRGEQMRHMGTLGGELLQRPRGWYFRNGFGLLAEHKSGSLIADGQNYYDAILGNSGPACFVSPSMLAPVLIALDARVRLHGPGGERQIALREFYVSPKTDGEREYAIQPNEILTQVEVPHPHGAMMANYEIREREGLDWPLVEAAAVLEMDGSSVKRAHVVLGHVAPVPWPSPEAEMALHGKVITEDVADEAGRAAVSKATPLSQNGYKVQLARVAIKRAILRAAKREV